MSCSLYLPAMSDPIKLSTVKFKAVRLLLHKKHRLKEGKCLIEGRRFVSDAIEAGVIPEMVLVTGDFLSQREGGELLRRARGAGVPVMTITAGQLTALSDTVSAQGVVAVVGLPGIRLDALPLRAGGRVLLIALDGVSDPGNVGTIVRTCAWFGADGLVLGEGTAEISNPKVLRSTMGAVFRLPVVVNADLEEVIPRMKQEGFRIVVAGADGSDTDDVLGLGEKLFLIFGSEAHGVRRELNALADAEYGIPKYGTGESLNVSVAVGVALGRYRQLRG